MKKSIFGLLLVAEGLVMLVATLVALYYHYTHGEEDWKALAIGTALTLGCGLTAWRCFHGKHRNRRMLSRGDSFIIVALAWVIFSFFGMVPYLLYNVEGLSVTDAYFETMSGFTTFGGSMLSRPEDLPHGLLLWRALTQGLGGLGIIVISMAIIPAGEMKNTNIFMAEASVVSMDRLRPKIGATARRLLAVYLLFVITCFALYWAGPMGCFDAICYAMATVSTGGFGTHAAGLGYFQSAYLEWVAIIFMLCSSINFATFYYLSARNYHHVFKNEELVTFILTYVGFVALFCLMFALGANNVEISADHVGGQPVRASLFHVASILSTCSHTGQFHNYAAWGSSFWLATIAMKFIGGCTYSTSGGLKIARVIVFARMLINQFIQHLHPRAVLDIRFNGHVLSRNVVRAAVTFLFLHLGLIVLGIFLFSLMNISLTDSIDLTVSSLSDVGPNINFKALPLLAKWITIFYMLAGRLEFFTLLFLFMPRAWKQ